jgi:hypothetical protein
MSNNNLYVIQPNSKLTFILQVWVETESNNGQPEIIVIIPDEVILRLHGSSSETRARQSQHEATTASHASSFIRLLPLFSGN